MLVLDTDHFSELERKLLPGQRLAVRLAASSFEKAVTVVTAEEGLQGRLAEISRNTDPHRQIHSYTKLQRQIEVLASWVILPLDSESAEMFLNFRRQGVRIGTMDLKIACIALAHDATLLTRNATDFAKVPGLRFKNWLD